MPIGSGLIGDRPDTPENQLLGAQSREKDVF
jgi:hypothetical protein